MPNGWKGGGIKLVEIEGIGPNYAAKLKKRGVGSVHALLKKGAQRAGRREMAEATGLSEGLILEWVNRADLFRIRGIGEEYSDLLESAGVDSITELAQRKPQNLHAMLAEINQKKNLVNRLPSRTQVENWVKHAKSLPRVIKY